MPVVWSAAYIIIVIINIVPLTLNSKVPTYSSSLLQLWLISHAEKPSVTVQKRLSPARAETYLLRRSE